MAKSIRENEKYPPSSIATFLEHLPSKTAADVRFDEGQKLSDEVMARRRKAKLTRCEMLYLTEVCGYGNDRLESFCKGREYNPALQVPTTKPGPYSQTHAVFMRIGDGDLYKEAIDLIRRADRYVYDGRRIEAGGPLPRGWKGKGKDIRLIDMLKAREKLEAIFNSPLYTDRPKKENAA